ncbi:P-loop containing nucleoside triphosphate hydrolase protein [Trichodelitschia bisporula]|uniref:P-loop containing nucleoside triphosphate hydrolase protein n=1 Tax=Trichodelitschia bisporula TaxID=703511 RepID=A0A6G1HMY9_9PEZI|nr:P-loop containing nucleoside triphosphate hydrolase protein [Trichodelitschia bisporula]
MLRSSFYRLPRGWKGFGSSITTPLSYSQWVLRPALSYHSSAAGRVCPSAEDSTIYALSTAPGRAAIAVVRVSGPACVEIYRALCPGKPLPKPRSAALRSLHDPVRTPDDVPLDAGSLVLFFPSPRSVTGEDVLEFHVHGGPAIVKAVLQALPRCASSSSPIRYAEPGEFTRRAFLNGRLDLTQVEALGDTLSAATEQQRRLFVRGTGNQLSKRYEEWRQLLLHARGELEALIDFHEDQHFGESPAQLAISVAHQVLKLKRLIDIHIRNAMRGELLRNGISIALLGPPNAGKSSLLNQIAGREAAIVSQEAGTTRDIVDIGIDLGGYLCKLADMAGLRQSTAPQQGDMDALGSVEKEGIRRAKLRASESDVVVVILPVKRDHNGEARLMTDSEVLRTAATCAANGSELAVVINKIDQMSDSALLEVWISELHAKLAIPPDRIFPISCKSAAGASGDDPGRVQAFLRGLVGVFRSMTSAVDVDSQADLAIPGIPAQSVSNTLLQESLGASERHRLLLQECMIHLESFLEQVETEVHEEGEPDIVVAAECLRAAADCLARITGRGTSGDVEEVLGVVFEKFCVGK